MAKSKSDPVVSDERGDRLELTPEEGALLQRLSQHMAYRARLYADLKSGPAGDARDDQYYRLDINQESLTAILEEVVASPGLAKAFARAGYSANELRLVGSDGAWNSDLAEAIGHVEAGRHRQDVSIAAEPVRQADHNFDSGTTGTRPSERNQIERADGMIKDADDRPVEALPHARQDAMEKQAQRGQPSLLQRLGALIGRREKREPKMLPQSGMDDDIPDSLRRRYTVHVSDNGRSIQLFETGAKAPAIMLDARSISTVHDSGPVIADVAALAQGRGWQSIKVMGTADFRDAIWLEARKLGLGVQHEPSPSARAAYVRWNQDRPHNEVQQARADGGQAPEPRPGVDLGQLFTGKGPEERLADPRLRNAQLELMVGIRTAEKELGRPIGAMPDVLRALTAAVGQQLSSGKVFDAPFVKPEPPKRAARQVTNPKIEADRIPPPRL